MEINSRSITYTIIFTLCFVIFTAMPVKSWSNKDHYGMDVSTLLSEKELSCLMEDEKYHFEFIIARCYRSVGSPDLNCVQTLKNAKAVGYKIIDAYHFPCNSEDPAQQIKDSLKNLRDNNTDFRRYWIDVELYKSPGWDTNTTKNVEFIRAMVNALKEEGQTDIGFYASHRCWPPITGNVKEFSEYPVWYAHYQVPEEPNFDDWVPYGGWTKPFMKQVAGDSNICGADIDVDWTPNDP